MREYIVLLSHVRNQNLIIQLVERLVDHIEIHNLYGSGVSVVSKAPTHYADADASCSANAKANLFDVCAHVVLWYRVRKA